MKKILSVLAAALVAVAGWAQPTPAQGVGRIIAGTNITVSPSSGTGGAVTVNSTAGGAGTVTSVSFTGGLISVGTPTTTPAFTVAGTSGGIPYFSSASTWATSAALGTSALVVGGGAGGAPSTPSATTTLDGSGNISTPGSLTVGAGGSVAGYVQLGQGTLPSVGTTAISIVAPASVTSYTRTLEGAVNSTGFYLGTVSGSNVTDTKVASTGTGSVVRADAPTLTGIISAASLTLSTNFDLGTAGIRMTNDGDGAMTWLGQGDGTDENLIWNLDDTTNAVVVTSSTGVVTLSLGAIGVTSTGTNSIGPLVDSVDGTTALLNQIQAFGAGTAYAFTNAAAAIDFGTTDPSITISNAGTYTIFAQVHVAYAGATVVAETATITVRRTNNTAADLGQSIVIDLPASTTLTESYGTVTLPPFTYTTSNTNDALTMNASVSATLAAGTINATAVGTSIIAIRRY